MSALPLPERGTDPSRAPRRDTDRVQRPRTPLALVPPRKSVRRRAPFVILCLVLVVAVVGVVLALNVQVARTQYDLVRMQSEQEDLTQSNQTLTSELNYRKAPQNLAAAAEDLNMVAAGQPGTVDLTHGTVKGKAKAAAASDDDATAMLDKPLEPQQQEAKNVERQSAAQAAATKAQDKASDSAQQSAKTEASSATSAAGSGAATAATTAKKADSKKQSTASNGDDATRAAFSEQTLNGGTIPAPRTR